MTAEPRHGGLGLAAALLIAAGTGFVALSYEILWFRVISYGTGSAPWSFGVLLAAYLLGVAVAARLCETFGARHPRPTRRHLAALGAAILLSNAGAYLVVPALAALAPHGSWPAALVLLAASSGGLGAALPFTAHLAIPPDARAGARVSYVYVADIAGSALGSLLTGYVLLDVLPMRVANPALAVVGFGVGAVLLAGAGLGRRAAVAGVAASALAAWACVAAAPALHDLLWERLQHRGDAPPERFARVVENRHGVIAASRDGHVYGGGVYDGMYSVDLLDDRNGIYRPLSLPAFHPEAREVLFIGLGSGAWVQAIANLPTVEHLTVIEINPGYLELMKGERAVESVVRNPKVTIVVDDGRRWLARHPERRFDAVVSNVTFHCRAHSTNLLSVEFARLVKAHLRDGGIYFFNTTFSPEVREAALEVFARGVTIGTFFVASDRPGFRYEGARLAAVLPAVEIDGRRLVDPADPAALHALDALVRADHPVRVRRPELEFVTDDNMRAEWRPTISVRP